ncbi:MAG: hypothetical protein ACRDZ2_11970 [Ilumatobacteraceae bacterium]
MATTVVIDDDELTRLALAADLDDPLPDDAVPWSGADAPVELLPSWYMPPTAAVRGRRRRVVVGVLIASFLLINAAGLCVTYGFAEIAW